jgi:hypothetical protein
MEDAPPVFYMGVDSNGRCVAPRIKPGLPHRLVVSMLIMKL